VAWIPAESSKSIDRASGPGRRHEPRQTEFGLQGQLAKVARDQIDAFNKSDWEQMRALLTSDARYHELGTERKIEGPDQIIELFKGWKTAFPDAAGRNTCRHLLRLRGIEDQGKPLLLRRNDTAQADRRTAQVARKSGRTAVPSATLPKRWIFLPLFLFLGHLYLSVVHPRHPTRSSA
jgi:hypothetical protein